LAQALAIVVSSSKGSSLDPHRPQKAASPMQAVSYAIVVFLAASCARADPPSLRGVDQIVVFDAGSSGTRVHVFSIDGGSSGSGVPGIDLAKRQTLKEKPGLSHYARNEDFGGAQKCIEKLIAFANQYVARRADTPVLLKATAGLRAVGQELADKVLQRVRETLCASGYKFSYDWANIIRGKEEGGLAWVAANYLRGAFREGGSTSPVGVVELGGGSTQVTFLVEDKVDLADDDSFVFTTLRGKQYKLYAHSYLGYGQDYTRKNYSQAMKGQAAADSTQKDPCMPEGGSLVEDGVTVPGKGDFQKCRSYIEDFIKWHSPHAPGTYQYEVAPQGNFIAIENFFYSRNGFENTQAENLKLEPATMEELATRACAKSYTSPLDENDEKRCFALTYQGLLLKYLGMVNLDVRIAHEIEGSEVDWALGAALVSYMENKQGHGMRAPCPGFAVTAPVSGMAKMSILFLGFLTVGSLIAWKGPFRRASSNTAEEVAELVSKSSPNLNKRSRDVAYGKVSASEDDV